MIFIKSAILLLLGLGHFFKKRTRLIQQICCSLLANAKNHFFLSLPKLAQAKEAARAAEAERAAKNAARKDKQWEVGAKDTSSAAEEAAKAAEREARAAAKRAQEAAEGGGAPVVQQKPGLQPTVTTGAWAN